MTLADTYMPSLGVTENSICEHDKAFRGSKGNALKSRVQSVAREICVDPGLLAAVLLAEDDDRNDYLGTTGAIDGYPLGTDSYYEMRSEIAIRVPAAKRVHILSHYDRHNELGHVVTIANFAAADAVLASGVYLKYKEVRITELLHTQGKFLFALPIEVRFALTRLGFNPGPMGIAHWVNMVARGENILICHGPSTQNARHPQRGATIHAARAIHLSQAIFGSDLT